MTAKPKTFRQSDTPCGYCHTGGCHDLCPGGVLNGNGTEVVLCGCDECETRMRCLRCGTRDHVNPETWECIEEDTCEANREASRNRARRDVFGQAAAERAAEAHEAKKTTTKTAPARSKIGSCLHCGESTKGGLFLPGHDSKYLSERVTHIQGGGVTLDQVIESWQSVGVSEALQAKLRKRVSA